MGGVTVRPASDREEEFRRACRRDRLVLASPIPRPASGSPARFWVTQRPPLPAPPPRHMADVGPAPSDAEGRIRAAAISARVRAQTEEVIKPLRRIAEAAAQPASQSATPESTAEDPYDLARW